MSSVVQSFPIHELVMHLFYRVNNKSFNVYSCSRACGELFSDQQIFWHLPHLLQRWVWRRDEPVLPHPGEGETQQPCQIWQRLPHQARAHHRKVKILILAQQTKPNYWFFIQQILSNVYILPFPFRQSGAGRCLYSGSDCNQQERWEITLIH